MGEAACDDLELLKSFSEAGGEAYFEELVGRHGQMVFGVCQRILGNDQEAEDTTQLVFLTLLRNAGHLDDVKTLGGWLHGVARHVALRQRKRNQGRRNWEGVAAERMDRAQPKEAWRTGMRPILDEALGALPEKYRLPIILHHLQGWSQEETARMMGCPPGTISTWLHHGRQALRMRLGNSGIVPSLTLLTLMLDHERAAATAGFDTRKNLENLRIACDKDSAESLGLDAAEAKVQNSEALETTRQTSLWVALAASLLLVLLLGIYDGNEKPKGASNNQTGRPTLAVAKQVVVPIVLETPGAVTSHDRTVPIDLEDLRRNLQQELSTNRFRTEAVKLSELPAKTTLPSAGTTPQPLVPAEDLVLESRHLLKLATIPEEPSEGLVAKREAELGKAPAMQPMEKRPQVPPWIRKRNQEPIKIGKRKPPKLVVIPVQAVTPQPVAIITRDGVRAPGQDEKDNGPNAAVVIIGRKRIDVLPPAPGNRRIAFQP